MKKLNRKATHIFHQLTAGLDADHLYRKLDNTNGTFMAIHVDYLHKTDFGTVYAIAHNYTQNGDNMADPDMMFLAREDEVFPMTYQQDGLGYFSIGLEIRDGQLLIAPRAQADMTSFANLWMANIAEQQRL